MNELMKRDAEMICFEDFMLWSGDEKPDEKPEIFVDPFGNTNMLPERFEPTTVFDYKKKAQHPCFTTSGHDYGKAPGQMELPSKWRGRYV